MSAPKTSRRSLLRTSLALGALGLVGTGVSLVRTSGYEVSEARARTLQALSPWQLVFVTQVARRMTAPDRPDDPGIPSSDEVDVAGFVDAYVARMPRALRRDLLRALTFVEQIAPLGAGYLSRFTALSPGDQDVVLGSLERSSFALVRGAFEGIKALVFMGYYRHPRTWKLLGYGGPLVGRPEGKGWTELGPRGLR